MEPYKEIEYKGMTIKIYPDEDAESPREWDNIGTIYSCHRSYNPDGHRMNELRDAWWNWDGWNEDNFTEFLDKLYFWLPIGYYEHGGITVWAGEPGHGWDSGCFGIIAVTKSAARKEYKGYKENEVREKTLKYLEGEIKDLDMYYTGEVYGFVAEGEDECEIESCWGFFGDDSMDEMIAQAKSAIDYELEERAEAERKTREAIIKAHLAKRKEQIKNHAPLYARTALVFA